ncbi:MAG: hypothetical protein H6718_21300 [Polyangiaceae bacterium]|nr:hypothetical protein [Myxococcales bacterium]MCB9587956.1 hypothetical protein [Polyangiaceae bacterium]
MRLPLCLLLGSLTLTACGSDDPSPSQEAGRECNHPEGQIEYSAESELGYSPEALLDPLLGDHTCVWNWNDLSGRDISPANFSLPPGEASSTLRFELGAGPLLYGVDTRPGDGNGAFSGCASTAIFAPVKLELSTADGVLDDDFEFDVGLYLGKQLEGETRIDPNQLEGYAFSWVDSTWQDRGLFLSIRAENKRLAGELSQRADFQSGSLMTSTGAVTGSFTCD